MVIKRIIKLGYSTLGYSKFHHSTHLDIDEVLTVMDGNKEGDALAF